MPKTKGVRLVNGSGMCCDRGAGTSSQVYVFPCT